MEVRQLGKQVQHQINVTKLVVNLVKRLKKVLQKSLKAVKKVNPAKNHRKYELKCIYVNIVNISHILFTYYYMI